MLNDPIQSKYSSGNRAFLIALAVSAAFTGSCTTDKLPTESTLPAQTPAADCVGDECEPTGDAAACEATSDCASGLYCTVTGFCTSDCLGVNACSVCTANGHCVEVRQSDNPFGAAVLLDLDINEKPDAAPVTCVDVDVEFERVTPTVALLIDQSGSMLETFPQGDGQTGVSRWATVVNTLTSEDGFVKRLDSSVRFGLALYTSDDGFGPEGANRVCPILTQTESISLGSFDEMKQLLQNPANGPSGDTPTGESVTAITAQLAAFAEEGPRSIILATDGIPDSCVDPDPNDRAGREATRAQSVAAVTAASEQGIETRVISVGDDVGLDHLKELAVAGAGGDPDAEAFQALNTQALENAFNDIIGSVRTCDFELGGTVLLDEARRGTVVLDGSVLAFDEPNGWEMPNDHTVRLLGSACDDAQAQAAELSMKFPCDVIELFLQ